MECGFVCGALVYASSLSVVNKSALNFKCGVFSGKRNSNARCHFSLSLASSSAASSGSTEKAIEVKGSQNSVEILNQFVKLVEGEFIGHEVNFSVSTGEAVSIPERFIPDAFRAWNVPVLGYDRITSTTVTDRREFFFRLSRLLPTAGCEADAVVADVSDFSYSFDTLSDSFAVPFSDGSFSVGPKVFDNIAKLTQCICFGTETGNRDDLRRVIVTHPGWIERVGTISVCIERYEGEYCAGAVLQGCGSRDYSFSKDQLTEETYRGDWTVNSHAAVEFSVSENSYDSLNISEYTSNSKIMNIVKHQGFPRGVSVTLLQSETGQIWIETGVVTDYHTDSDSNATKQQVISRQYDSDGNLERICRFSRTK
uniref:Uncharacterized protein n=1 Tax=Timspurckia oligopyrenoides TaxID=708627 RepID=A0A7S0ZC52_9RHOD|mmetsp:Transcript_12100/g.21877  ORF Transcript_12100/g.21877 Transcript_12100/m.21877 type:complete len:368 (+) Transcript_12100:40-1143(+)